MPPITRDLQLGLRTLRKSAGLTVVDVDPLDPIVFGGVALTLAVTGTLACLLPAQRATRVDPSDAMRSE